MKTKKIVELVEVERWACNVPTHRHKTSAVAEACIAKRQCPKPRRRWTMDEMIDAFEAVLDGATLKKAAQPYGISAVRIRDIVNKVRRKAMHPSFLNGGCDYRKYDGIPALRENAPFWKEQIAKLREHYKVQKNA